MKTVTLKECAHDLGLSYESVRRLIRRHMVDLNGHISRTGRTQYLDEWAVEFLKQHRRANPVTVVRQDQFEKIKEQQEQIERMKEQILEAQRQIIELQKEHTEMLEAKIQNKYLLADNDRLRQEADQAKAEAGSFRRSLFGFYRKQK